jgi:hypothetical protein
MFSINPNQIYAKINHRIKRNVFHTMKNLNASSWRNQMTNNDEQITILLNSLNLMKKKSAANP